MGAFLDKPKTEKHNEAGEGNGLRYGLSSMQGWRIDMEDNHCAQIGIPDLKDWSFFAVFDGHAGSKVSAYGSQKLLDAIITNEDFGKSGEPGVDNLKKAIKTGFLGLDDRMREIPELASGEDKSGSTCIATLISPRHVIFANCGDSRAIFSRDNSVVCSTQDHKPVNPLEKERIQNAGGSVMIQRVNGSLAVSRALGDFEYKNVQGKGPCEQLVSPEPEIQIVDRNESLDEFLVLACDGVWDVMSNEELKDYIRHCMQRTSDLKQICNDVVDTCLYKGSRDNISIEIIAFKGAPKLSDDAIKKEAELDARLEAKIKELLSQCGPNDNVTSLMHLLARDTIEGLPPGGGLPAKRHKIDEILQRLSPTPLEDDLS